MPARILDQRPDGWSLCGLDNDLSDLEIVATHDGSVKGAKFVLSEAASHRL
jgi:hypothetical protein